MFLESKILCPTFFQIKLFLTFFDDKIIYNVFIYLLSCSKTIF